MTSSAPTERASSTRGGLATPGTPGPDALASWTANHPTAPAAPMTRTCCPGWTSPTSRTPWSAANPEMGTTAASSKLRAAGLAAKWSSPAQAYSAKEPSHQPNTSSPGRNRVTRAPTARRARRRPCPERDLGLAQPERRDHQADHVGQAGHDVPVAPMQASRMDLDQHLVVGGHRLVDVPELQHLGPAIAVLDDRLHGALPRTAPPVRSRSAWNSAANEVSLVRRRTLNWPSERWPVSTMRRRYRSNSPRRTTRMTGAPYRSDFRLVWYSLFWSPSAVSTPSTSAEPSGSVIGSSNSVRKMSRGVVPSTSSATAAMKWYLPRRAANAWSTAAITWVS